MKIRTALRTVVLATVALTAGAVVAAGGPAAAADVQPQAIGTYYVDVHTANLDDAGTSGRVRLTAFGDEAQSPGTTLGWGFDRGTTRHFGPFNWIHLGNIGYISLGKNGDGSDWIPEYVDIYAQHTGTLFHCDTHYARYPASGDTKFFDCVKV